MAKQGVLRVNPDRTLVEIDTPDEQEWGPEPWPEDQLIVLSDEDSPESKSYVAVLDGYGNLKPNTIYELVEVSTLVEEEDLDGEDDEEATGE